MAPERAAAAAAETNREMVVAVFDQHKFEAEEVKSAVHRYVYNAAFVILGITCCMLYIVQ